MYTGHVAIALAARGVRRDLPLWVAVVASQAPDWVEVICVGLGAGATAQLWSHAFPFVLLAAVVAATVVRLWTRSTGAALVTFAVYVSHPLADLVTGHKPLWLGGPPIGLWFIERPAADFVVQSALCILGWVIYRRSLPPHVRGRLIAVAPLVTLLALQGVSDLVVLVRKPFRTEVTDDSHRPSPVAGSCQSQVIARQLATSHTTGAPHHARAADAPRRTCDHARCCGPCSSCDRTSERARTTPSREVGALARRLVT